MSSLKQASRRAAQFLGVIAIAASLGGCLRPLYGPTASGERLDAALAAIDVATVTTPQQQQRVSHYLRSELIYELNGSGVEQPKRYKLTVALSERLQTPIVDTETGRANSATIIADATYTLTTADGSRVIAQGNATNSATYDRTIQRFATLRAARDAEIRLAKQIAEQIKMRIAVALRADPVAL